MQPKNVLYSLKDIYEYIYFLKKCALFQSMIVSVSNTKTVVESYRKLNKLSIHYFFLYFLFHYMYKEELFDI